MELATISLSTTQLLYLFSGIAALLISAHIFGNLFSRFKLPKVVGEIIGGIVLGPTLLGFFFSGLYTTLFNAFSAEGSLLALVYEFGLVFLMFVTGFELKRFFEERDRKLTWILMICSTAIPLTLGFLIFSSYNFSFLLGSANNMLALEIIFVTSVAVTSIPVISKIFLDLGLAKTRFAKVILGAATAHDTVLYTMLAIATGIVTATAVSVWSIAEVVIATVLFFVFSLLIISRLIERAGISKYNFLARTSPLGYLILILFLFSAIALLLGVNIMFGAFLAGICVSTLPDNQFKKAKEGVYGFSFALFIPLYFAIVGLQLDLIHYLNIVFMLEFLGISSLVQMIGSLIAAKIYKLDWRSSFNLAITMNARGGPGIVLATTAYSLGIINESFFVTLILAAMITSLIAGWWLKREHAVVSNWRF